jgi:hypothetical protein
LQGSELVEVKVKEVKDKPIPVQAWTSPEVSRRLSVPDVEKIGT